MLKQIKQWLEPPVFHGDEEKTAQARTMNALGLYFVSALALATIIYIPLFAKHQAESWAVILTLFVLYAVSRRFLFRGQVKFAGIFMIASGWLVCEGLVFISGGISSPMMFALTAITIALGLLFNPRIGTVFLVLNILFGLGFAALQQSGVVSLPDFFVYSPLGIWFYFALSLLFINGTMNLTVRQIENALALARRKNDALEKTEVTLLNSQTRLQALTDATQQSFVLMDRDAKILSFNRIAARNAFVVFGADMKEGDPMVNFILEQERAQFTENFNKALRGEIVTVEQISPSFVWRDHWVASTYNPAHANDGEVVGVCLNAIDVTERRNAEAALQNSERRLQALIENGLDYISLLDIDGNLLWESPSSTNILDYRFNEFIGKSIFEIIHPDDQKWIIPQFAEVAQKPSSRRAGIFRLCRADGSYRWVEAIVSNFLHDPAVGALVVNYRDVTERKQAEESVLLSEARYRQAITAAGAVPYYRDYQKDEHAYTFMGEGIFHLTGYSAEEITPAIFDQIEQEAVMRGALAHLTSDEAGNLSDAGEIRHWACDYRILTRDGQTRWVADSAIQVRDENNRRLGVIGILQDITDRKRVEEDEREQRALAEALSNSAAALNNTLNFDEVMDRVLDNVGRVVPHDAANIMLLDKDDDTLSIAYMRNYIERDVRYDAALQLSLTQTPVLAEAARDGRAMLVPDTHANPAWIDVPTTRWICSYLTVPIQIRQRVVGFLNLDSATPGFFNSYHAERLQAFANHAAIAIENARLYEEVQKLAVTDSVTGIFNRTFFETELKRMEFSRDFPVSIIVADLDNMKKTNDALGHAAGDELLRRTVQTLQAAFRASDIIARIGGDEFAVLLPNTDQAKAQQFLARVREKLDAYNAVNPDLSVRLSLGASTAEHGHLLAMAFTIADRHMYADKAMRKSNDAPTSLTG